MPLKYLVKDNKQAKNRAKLECRLIYQTTTVFFNEKFKAAHKRPLKYATLNTKLNNTKIIFNE